MGFCSSTWVAQSDSKVLVAASTAPPSALGTTPAWIACRHASATEAGAEEGVVEGRLQRGAAFAVREPVGHDGEGDRARVPPELLREVGDVLAIAGLLEVAQPARMDLRDRRRERLVLARQPFGTGRHRDPEGFVRAGVVANRGDAEQRVSGEDARADVGLRLVRRRRVAGAVVSPVVGRRRRERDVGAGILVDDLHEHVGERPTAGARHGPLDDVTSVTRGPAVRRRPVVRRRVVRRSTMRRRSGVGGRLRSGGRVRCGSGVQRERGRPMRAERVQERSVSNRRRVGFTDPDDVKRRRKDVWRPGLRELKRP
jgi:hypothetical protein